MCVGAINVLVTSGDTHKLLTCLQDDNARLRDFCPQYIDAYAHHLAQIKNTRLNTTSDYSFHCLCVCLSVCHTTLHTSRTLDSIVLVITPSIVSVSVICLSVTSPRTHQEH